MNIKKLIIICLFVYISIGLYTFGPRVLGNKSKEVQSKASEMKIQLEWDVANELKGNYRTPLWLKNDEYKKYVEEVDSRKKVLDGPELTSAYQLMSLLAQLQLGDPTIASSFVNPYLSHSDYTSKKVADITEKSKSLASRITQNQSLAKVKVSEPIPKNDNEVSHDVNMRLKSGKEITIRNIPMVKVQEEHEDASDHDKGMWYMNINLQELAQRVKKKE
ncbi:hypothetical protein [Paenibacillus cremeus]|uniref:Uncharacterized protein n=1 Tax=Paenibacillus cremeus TaxID=2163881 RepID=A0A559JHS8_9BACL|nr:hypothetical protein [Paenibacillus cremeus]TVX99433.1 hypothetical protein FPZ49_33720 [Paenibacillus cremeus]